MMPANHQPPGVVPQYHQPSPMNQQQQNFASGAVVTQSQVQDRFSRHMTPQPTKICGDLLITLGVFMLVGQILELIEFGIYTEYANSLVGYTGFWGGVIVIVCGSIITHTSKSLSDNAVIADVICAVIGLVFSIIVLSLPAEQIRPFQRVTSYKLLRAGYGLLIGCGVLGMLVSLGFTAFCVVAILRGFGVLSSTVPVG